MAEPTVREALTKAVAASAEETTPETTPETPKVPETPETPETPKTPETPETSPEKKPAEGETPPEVKKDQTPAEKREAEAKAVERKAPEKKVEDKKDELPRGFDAPQSWRAPIKEKFWNKLPSEVQVEVLRREKEVQGILKSSGEFKATHESVNKMVSDYNDVFSRETTTPDVTMRNLLNVVRVLQTAPSGVKAQHMAALITSFGVDVAMLDTALSAMVQNGVTGERKPGDDIRQILQTELAPVREFMGSMRKRAEAVQHKSAATLQADIEAFAADPANEYFDLVAEDMADLMDLASARHQKLSLSDAYQRAIMTRSDISGAIARKKLEEAAGQRSAAADKAKNKADLSTTGAPVAGNLPSGEVPTIREALMAAMSVKA